MKLKLKKGDKVRVISGSDRGKEGKILKIIPLEGKVIVESVAMVTKRIKPSASSPQGSIIKKERPVDISNLMLVLSEGILTRVGFRVEEGKIVRYSKKTGEIIK